jgi:hypothetical protein
LAIPSSSGAAGGAQGQAPALSPDFEEDRRRGVLGGQNIGCAPEAVGMDRARVALVEVAERLCVAGPSALPQLRITCHHV